MAKLVVESITPPIIQVLRNFRLSRVRWLPSQGPS
jgi:hypothetical protein